MAQSDAPTEDGIAPVIEAQHTPGEAAATVAENSGLGSLADDLRELADDAQTLVEAELAYQSARAAYAWNRGSGIAIWLIIALTAGFFTALALVVGLLLALIPHVGVWGSLAIVAASLALTAVLALLRALGKFKRMRTVLLERNPMRPPTRLVPSPLPEKPLPEKPATGPVVP